MALGIGDVLQGRAKCVAPPIKPVGGWPLGLCRGQLSLELRHTGLAEGRTDRPYKVVEHAVVVAGHSREDPPGKTGGVRLGGRGDCSKVVSCGAEELPD